MPHGSDIPFGVLPSLHDSAIPTRVPKPAASPYPLPAIAVCPDTTGASQGADKESRMLAKPQIVETGPQLTAIIRHTIPRDEIRKVMGPSIAEVVATVTAQGIPPAGPVFSHHLRMDPAMFDFEVGLPVTAPVVPIGRVKAGHLPATTVARAVYHGPYEGLAAAWAELDAWIAAEGHTPAPDLWESYVAGPESSPDPATWRTELNRPLLR